MLISLKIDLEELYWADWDDIEKRPDELEAIFRYIKDFESLDLKEISQILRLYNNPHGAFTIEFAEIIADIYKSSRVRFFKALTLVDDESPNLIYALRMQKAFDDEDVELSQILELNRLSDKEVDVATIFFKMYKRICMA